MYPIKNIQSKITYTAKKSLCCLLISIALSGTTHAIILYSGDNNANLTAPDTAREAAFNSTAKISNSDGSGIVGSAVHIQGKYLLTAEHVLYKDVTPRRTYITFDSITYWEIDLNFLPIQIGTADLVLFKLIENPNLPETQLYNSTNEYNKTGTLVGWGYGRDLNQTDLDLTQPNRRWDWGGGSTIKKRWGTNKIDFPSNQIDSPILTYTLTNRDPDVTYTFAYLRITLDSGISDNEAGFAYYDSGCGIFISHFGSWQLAGISSVRTVSEPVNPTASIPNPHSSFGSDSSNRDFNYFVRISEYRQTILNNIPDTSIYSDWAIDQSLYGTDAETTADPDADGLDNQTEFSLGTNPNLADSDSDGLIDGDEVNTHSTDPLDADSDDDDLSDGDEINTYQSNPNDNDSDDDGLIDGEEVNTHSTSPTDNDSDNDALSDSAEINTHSTNPNDADSDDDGLSDNDEINTYQSDPNDADTSNDGISDQALVDYGLDPNVDHTLLYNATVQSIADLRAGATIIEVINNQATITLKLESSNDLESWFETGDNTTLQVSSSNDTQFYRFKLSD